MNCTHSIGDVVCVWGGSEMKLPIYSYEYEKLPYDPMFVHNILAIKIESASNHIQI